MEPTKHRRIKNKLVGCSIYLISAILLLLLFVQLVVSNYYTLDNLGNGYILEGDLEFYDVSYQRTPFEMPKTVYGSGFYEYNADKNWITIRFPDGSIFVIDKSKKPRFDTSRHQILMLNRDEIVQGPMDSLAYQVFAQENNIDYHISRVCCYYEFILEKYCIILNNRDIWYLAEKVKSSYGSSPFMVVIPSPVDRICCYDNKIYCITKDDTYWVVDASQPQETAISKLGASPEIPAITENKLKFYKVDRLETRISRRYYLHHPEKLQ